MAEGMHSAEARRSSSTGHGSGHGHGHAVVVGGGYAGLVAARVLARRFDAVTVIEADRIDPGAGPAHRKGTPQSRHPHALLARGAEILERLFPGLRAELAAHGAPLSDFGCFPMLYPTGWSPRVTTGIPLQTFSRPLLDAAIRRRVLALPVVALADRTHVDGLVLDAGRRRVTGVRIRVRTAVGPAQPPSHRTLPADLVVIATGRHSRLPQWLTDAGLPAPAALSVDAGLSYASRVYRRDAAATDPDWQASLQATLAPAARRGGAVLAIEERRWLVCLFGADGEMAPTDPGGFAEYAASLTNPHIGQIVAAAQPLGPVHRYAGLGGQWHRYDRLRPWPGGLVVLGDALCSLNPLYGHGMTVAAMQAVLLGRELNSLDSEGDYRNFQRRAARTLRFPWLLTSSLDLGWRTEGVPLTAALSRRMLHRFLRRIPDDPTLYRRFLKVQHMTASPATLLIPSFVRRGEGSKGTRSKGTCSKGI
ncbi:FAD-dependent oxidoreductase [Streptomyces sp. NPDC057654]|uniref:FAD-dependent oxidoreductase n=1 Tax=Streptomyces sp. NPDC057654 TaxID=3346196 RepID=UPI0036A4B49F